VADVPVAHPEWSNGRRFGASLKSGLEQQADEEQLEAPGIPAESAAEDSANLVIMST
jgi:hypothetical protein